jgi:branched-chain amino acid transport system substrate-binding protein
VDLARREIARVMSGTNAQTGGASPAHPIALVACDDVADPARAVRHLVDDVGVPAVIGFRTSQEAIDLATSTLVPRGVLAMSALNSSPMLTRLPHPAGAPRLVWRTALSAAQTASPAAMVVSQVLEPAVRAASLGPKAPMRVALVRQDDAAGQGFGDAFFRELRFNGRPAVENGASFQELVFPLDAGRTATSAPYDAVAAKVAAYAPHVVVYFGADETFVRVLAPLEDAWPAGTPRPRYFKPAVFSAPVRAFVGRDAERRRRFLGLTSVSSSIANARFVSRYNAAYHDPVTRTFSPNSSYDAFYVLAYATYAVGAAPITGTSLARAFARLVPPGEPADVGPGDVFAAFEALRADRHVDLNGATGRLDFDLETGESSYDFAVLCLAIDERGDAVDSEESGLVFDAASRTLHGDLRCP